MHLLPDFKIGSNGRVSSAFLKHSIATFYQAIEIVQQLRYARNSNKEELTLVLTEQCGTCSSKHALLKQLADENGQVGLKLMLGFFRMNAENTPKVARILQYYGLKYIPEAHNYLGHRQERFDFTRPGSKPEQFVKDLISETVIAPADIGATKVRLHQQFLQSWLQENKAIRLSGDEIWSVREACIEALSTI